MSNHSINKPNNDSITDVRLYIKDDIPMISFESYVDITMFPAEYHLYPAGTKYVRKRIDAPQSMYPAYVYYYSNKENKNN
jgi:hypothetical protein